MKKTEKSIATFSLNSFQNNEISNHGELEWYKAKLKKAEHKVRILEDMIENQARKLYLKEAENEELEMFTYVASHDLQEPLRTVSVYVDLLVDQYQEQFDGKANKYIEFISQASNRMSVQIKDLLDYSRLGKQNTLEKIDCTKLLDLVVQDLGALIHESGADIMVNEMPTIYGYSTELKLLFQNLISNSIKFRKDNAKPLVVISSNESEDHWRFSVEDNGIGIDDKYNEKIFQIFQRLHNKEYAGTGIGLTHCKKIVELHGGTIWVDSIPGQGSTFNFIIKKRIT